MLRWDVSFHLWHICECSGVGKSFISGCQYSRHSLRHAQTAPCPKASSTDTTHTRNLNFSSGSLLADKKYRLQQRVMPSTKVEQVSVSRRPLEHGELGNTSIHIAATYDCAELIARCPHAVAIVMLHCSAHASMGCVFPSVA